MQAQLLSGIHSTLPKLLIAKKFASLDSLYLGPYGYDNKEIGHLADDYNATLEKVKMEDVVKLMCEKNIVANVLRTS